jgi:hypothetical protein
MSKNYFPGASFFKCVCLLSGAVGSSQVLWAGPVAKQKTRSSQGQASKPENTGAANTDTFDSIAPVDQQDRVFSGLGKVLGRDIVYHMDSSPPKGEAPMPAASASRSSLDRAAGGAVDGPASNEPASDGPASSGQGLSKGRGLAFTGRSAGPAGNYACAWSAAMRALPQYTLQIQDQGAGVIQTGWMLDQGSLVTGHQVRITLQQKPFLRPQDIQVDVITGVRQGNCGFMTLRPSQDSAENRRAIQTQRDIYQKVTAALWPKGQPKP